MTADELAAMIAEEIYNNSGTRAILAKVQRGTATLADSERFTGITAEITGRLLADNVLSLPLSDRQGAFLDITAARYRDTFSVFSAVQRALDERLGINLAVVDPGFEKARAQKAGHALADQTVPESTVVRRAESAGENIVRSQHDRIVQKQAEFRDRAGLQCSAIREGGAKCCEWCASVSGKYSASDTPQGFWGRHDNCKCSILYETRKGVQRLGGSTKKWEPLEDAGAPEPTRLTAEQAAEREAQHPVISFSPEQAKSLQDSVLTNGGNRATMMLNDSGTPFYPVTQESLASIPHVTAFPDERVNRAVEEQCRAILEAVQNDEIRTECTVSIRLSDLHSEMQKGGQGEGTVTPIRMDQPFISIHNHASNETISPRDARMLVFFGECQAVVVIGNKGDKLYILQKDDTFNADGLYKAIREKIKPENSHISDSDFLRGCEQYGTKYFE